jgi:hypothetical protein
MLPYIFVATIGAYLEWRFQADNMGPFQVSTYGFAA